MLQDTIVFLLSVYLLSWTHFLNFCNMGKESFRSKFIFQFPLFQGKFFCSTGCCSFFGVVFVFILFSFSCCLFISFCRNEVLVGPQRWWNKGRKYMCLFFDNFQFKGLKVQTFLEYPLKGYELSSLEEKTEVFCCFYFPTFLSLSIQFLVVLYREHYLLVSFEGTSTNKGSQYLQIL